MQVQLLTSKKKFVHIFDICWYEKIFSLSSWFRKEKGGTESIYTDNQHPSFGID